MPRRKATTETMKVSEARREFSQLLNKVFRGETRVIVEKSGIPVAAIISAADLERLGQAEAEREQQFKALEETWQAFKDVPVEEIEDEVAKSVAEARRKLREKSKGDATAA